MLAWFNGTVRGRQLQVAAAVAFTAAVSAYMFEASDRGPTVPWWDRLHLRMHPQRMSADAVNELLDNWLPLITAACAIGYALVCVRWLLSVVGESLDVLCCCCGRRRDGDTLRRLAAEAAAAAVTAANEHEGATGAKAAGSAAVHVPLVHVPKCAPFKRRLRACCSLATAPLHLAACAALFGASMVMLLTLRQQTCLDPSRAVFSQALARWSDGVTSGPSRKGAAPNGGLLAWPVLKRAASLADTAWSAALQGGIASFMATAPWHVTSGYGLFRSMTGVGPTRHDDATGLPYVTTERPEIIIEGLFLPQDLGLGLGLGADTAAETGSSNVVLTRAARSAASQIALASGQPSVQPTDAWLELPLRFKPSGDVYARQGQVAPHQPRLDWQMWFAALGDYHSAPWLVRLVHLLLQGSPPAYSLLDGGRYPVKRWLALSGGAGSTASVSSSAAVNRTDASTGGLLALVPPVAIRARLFHYDFTRADVPWGRQRVPPLDPCAYANSSGAGTLTAKKSCRRDMSLGYGSHDDTDNHGHVAHAEPFWQRRFVREYLPAVTRHEASLEAFCAQHGWSKPAFAFVTAAGDAGAPSSLAAAAGSIATVSPVVRDAAQAAGQSNLPSAAFVSLPLGGSKSESRRALLLGDTQADTATAAAAGHDSVSFTAATAQWWRGAWDHGSWKRCRKAAARIQLAKVEAGASAPLLAAAQRVARGAPSVVRACSAEAWNATVSPPLAAAGTVARQALHTGVRAARLMGLLPPGPGFVVPRGVVSDVSANGHAAGVDAAAAAALRAAGIVVSQSEAKQGGFAMAADSHHKLVAAGADTGASKLGQLQAQLPHPGSSVLAPLVITGPALEAASALPSLQAARADGGAALPSAHASSLWWLVGLVGGKAVLEFMLALLADSCGSSRGSDRSDSRGISSGSVAGHDIDAVRDHSSIRDGRNDGSGAEAAVVPEPPQLRSSRQAATDGAVAAAATTASCASSSSSADHHADAAAPGPPRAALKPQSRTSGSSSSHGPEGASASASTLRPAPTRDDRAAVRRFLTQGL